MSIGARALDRELDAWVAESLVTRTQADAIRRRNAEHGAPGRRERVVSTLAVIGAVAGGLGVILFFAANWDGIPRPARVALVLATILGAYGGGDALRRSRPAVGQALLLLGAIAFGASLFLVGQMYHVQAHDPLAFLVWTAACVPTALVARSRPVATLSLLTFGAWLAFELSDRGWYWLFAPTAVAVGAGMSLLGWSMRSGVFREPLRRLGFAALALGTFGLTFGEAAHVLSDHAAAVPAGALVIGANLAVAALALGAIAVGHARDERWLATAGVALVALELATRYVDVLWNLLPGSLAFLGAGVVLLALALAFGRRTRALRGAEART